MFEDFKHLGKCVMDFNDLNLQWYKVLQRQEIIVNNCVQKWDNCNIELIKLFLRKSKWEFNNYEKNKNDSLHYICNHLKSNIYIKNMELDKLENIKTCDDLNNIYKNT